MFILDSLFIGGLRFILDKIVEAAEAEMNDDSALREALLAAQMRVELGEMTDEEYAAVEAEILQRLREIRERTRGPASAPGEFKVTGIDATFTGDESDEARG